jgi:hypothetical protein
MIIKKFENLDFVTIYHKMQIYFKMIQIIAKLDEILIIY